jgi:SAM-dependent methyltransferase
VGARDALFDQIAGAYAAARRTEPRIAAQIWAALGSARTVLNVGAGTGSYEPSDRDLLAVEPSARMRGQRPADAAPCIAAVAEALPCADQSFDVAMAILSDHHWRDPIKGLEEMRRVARRVVVLQWDETWLGRFWLVRDYLPEVVALSAATPGLAARVRLLGARIEPVPIPADCVDGFFHANWRRPAAYLDKQVRRGTSVWSRVGPAAEQRAVAGLSADLHSGHWQAQNEQLLELPEVDLGARLLVSD